MQSSAMYLMACDGILTPRPQYAIFADTQDERRATYDWLSQLSAAGNIPIIVASAGKLSDEVLRSMRETPSRFVPIPTYRPGNDGREQQGRRQCTRSHKTEVIYQEVRKLLGLERGQRAGDLVAEVWIGISLDEASRAKDSRYPILRHRFPLLFDQPMRRSECARWLERRLGAAPPKSSCVYCPFRSDADWQRLREEDPDAFGDAVAFERQMHALDPTQFLHDSCKPLDSVVFDRNAGQMRLFAECEGMCGV